MTSCPKFRHPGSLALDIRRFLDLDFVIADPADWLSLLCGAPQPGPLRILVTPNVDHVVQLSRRPALREVYAAADWRMCDSRILERLAALRGIELRCYPGADLVRDLLCDPRARTRRIAVIGPDLAEFDLLTARFPDIGLIHVPAPFMQPESPEWRATLEAAERCGAEIFLLCLSFPKQEIFARDLKARGAAQGVALCVGASIDFLTGRQERAPAVLRRAGLEWLHRLLSQPRRLWKRYLVDGPRIFLIFLRDRRS